MGAGAGSWEKAQQEGGDPLHRSDGGVGAGSGRGEGGTGGEVEATAQEPSGRAHSRRGKASCRSAGESR